MDQSHLTPERGQPQQNDLVQHTVGKPCSINCVNEWLSGKHITATDESDSKTIKNINKTCTIINYNNFSNFYPDKEINLL